FIIFGAGVVLFLVAFLALGFLPMVVKGHLKVNVVTPERVPSDLARYFKTPADYKAALLQGRDLYISENCWNCHTQYVRPVANDPERYGSVASMEEYQNDMNLPQLFGTRRVGPDLSREKGKHSNDWHFAHLYDPKIVVPESVMPRYPWFFDKAEKPGIAPKPTARGVALVAYLQWLGTEAEKVEAMKEKELSR
ncbi:MAG: cbb3-type cytochrome c oxidase subunit II, partial [Planctomycetota bacterium]